MYCFLDAVITLHKLWKKGVPALPYRGFYGLEGFMKRPLIPIDRGLIDTCICMEVCINKRHIAVQNMCCKRVRDVRVIMYDSIAGYEGD